MTNVSDAKSGLPEEVFLMVSALTPLVNVDLLIQQNSEGATQTLLTWRRDQFYTGWHFPGGIMRFKETPTHRVHAVAEQELGARVKVDSTPILVTNMISEERNTRGHFISLLYRCELLGEMSQIPAESEPLEGEWRWHLQCPSNLIPQHLVYKHYFQTGTSNE